MDDPEHDTGEHDPTSGAVVTKRRLPVTYWISLAGSIVALVVGLLGVLVGLSPLFAPPGPCEHYGTPILLIGISAFVISLLILTHFLARSDDAKPPSASSIGNRHLSLAVLIGLLGIIALSAPFAALVLGLIISLAYMLGRRRAGEHIIAVAAAVLLSFFVVAALGGSSWLSVLLIGVVIIYAVLQSRNASPNGRMIAAPIIALLLALLVAVGVSVYAHAHNHGCALVEKNSS